MKIKLFSTLMLLGFMALGAGPSSVSAQNNIPPSSVMVDDTGRIQIQVPSSSDKYYLLFFREDLGLPDDQPVSMALGEDGTTTLTEVLAAYPKEHYRVAEYSIATPGDIDADGIDDITEFNSHGRLNPLNPADEIALKDGTVSIVDREMFEHLSYQGEEVLRDTHLTDLEYVKFYLLEMNTDNPKVYFMNTVTHRSHGSFRRAVGIESGGGGRGGQNLPGQMRGEIIYHPHVIGPNGKAGIYRFEFQPNDNYPFADIQKSYEVIAKQMLFLENNWVYYPMPSAALPRYWEEKELYDASRVAIVLEEDILADYDYIPLNLAEGYGLLRHMDPNERPNPRDIVLYEALPNEMPRVGGIITTVGQTPLSHVNLRAIQDGVPNAFIKEALEKEDIANLIGKHVYYRVGAEEYEIREASLAEVEAHHAAQRPILPQVPVRDLSLQHIADLDDISFDQWSSFGVKAANVATLRGFGFPEGTIRDGFAVPFYLYDEFMKHNGLYEEVRALLDDPQFQSDYDVQEAKLKELRDTIEDAPMPEWMLEELATMHANFPSEMSIRVRSSTNNEDLPGFSGAGLYDSYTHRPDEGHIAKSIKQVYASLWNFRAFDERQFYRIDHFQTAMGVLVHQSFSDEQSNGVGVTKDPIYQTQNTYYLNSQVGENLVTNPDALSIPEEILLDADEGGSYNIVRPSNQVADGEQVMSEEHLESLRQYLTTIDAEFRKLYAVEGEQAETFAMEIEYKVTQDGILAIKQARPWLSGDLEAPKVERIYLPIGWRG